MDYGKFLKDLLKAAAPGLIDILSDIMSGKYDK